MITTIKAKKFTIPVIDFFINFSKYPLALESQQYNLALLQHKKIGHGYHGLEKINTSLKNFPTKLYYLVL